MNLKTQTEAFNLAKAAGFGNADAEIAAAIAMAETLTFVNGKQYCNFDAIGDTSLVNATWGPSYGAWQVRSLIADEGTGRFRDATRLPDPLFNAKSAYAIWKNAGNKFTPWSTFQSGAYKGYMQQATYNPKPVIPAGTYLVTGGDSLSLIASKTKPKEGLIPVWTWQLIAAINNLKSPYTIFPGQVILLPDWVYTVASGDTLTKIASTVSTVTWERLAEYNKLVNPNILSVGQKLRIPRYVSWDGQTLIR